MKQIYRCGIVCAALSAFSLAMLVDANAAIITDQFILQTSGQSLYGPNAWSDNSWSYNSGFQGASYGTYTNPPSSPSSFGINAITGELVHVPAVVIPGECVWGFCTPDIEITPAYDLDTRTGAALGAQSSGRIGVNVTAAATGGSVSVTLPVFANLEFGEVLGGPGFSPGAFSVRGLSAISGGSIQIAQPAFTANIDGILNFDNVLSGTGCFLGAGCSSSSSSVNLDPGQFSLISLNTQNSKPISAFGLGLPIAKLDKTYAVTTDTDGNICVAPCEKNAFDPPALLRVTPYSLKNWVQGGLSGTSGQTLNASGQQTVLTVDADLTGIAQKALGASFDYLNPSITFGKGIFSAGTISGKLFDAQAGIKLGLSQSVSFTPSIVSTLTFTDAMEQFFPELSFALPIASDPANVSQSLNSGRMSAIPLISGWTAAPLLLRYADGQGNLLKHSYTIEDATNWDFIFKTAVTIDPNLLIRPPALNLSWRLISAVPDCNALLIPNSPRLAL